MKKLIIITILILAAVYWVLDGYKYDKDLEQDLEVQLQAEAGNET